MSLLLLRVGDIASCRIVLCFITLLGLRFITRSSWSSDSNGCLERKKGILSHSNVEDNIPYWGMNFQTKLIIGVIKDGTFLDDKHDGYMKAW
jgi:hypothetical protein